MSSLEEVPNVPHEWIPSTLGHGTSQCKHCFATDRELAALGEMNHCDVRAGRIEEGVNHV